MLSQLRTLSLFVDIAQAHHVATGAAKHGLTQGAASQRIQQLEKELGVPLFDRARRPLQLTAAGRVFWMVAGMFCYGRTLAACGACNGSYRRFGGGVDLFGRN